jgi:hypothetical protein
MSSFMLRPNTSGGHPQGHNQQSNQTVGAVSESNLNLISFNSYFERLSNSYQSMNNNLMPTDSPVTDKIHHLSAANPSRSYQPMESVMAEPFMPYLSNCQQPASNHDSHTALQWPTSSLYQDNFDDLSKRFSVNRLLQMDSGHKHWTHQSADKVGDSLATEPAREMNHTAASNKTRTESDSSSSHSMDSKSDGESMKQLYHCNSISSRRHSSELILVRKSRTRRANVSSALHRHYENVISLVTKV